MAALRDYLYGSGDDALDQSQVDTLDLLASKSAWRMSELAEALRVDPSTATRFVARLVGEGFAERHPSEDDGRVVEVSITPAGLARHERARSHVHELMKHILDSFDPDEARELAELMERLVGSIDGFVHRICSERS